MEAGYKTVLLADRVYEKLEHDILFGIYPKGKILTELSLAGELGVSRTPIREAMRRLAQEGLISEQVNGKGSVVLGITKEDVEDIMEIRCRLEALAARYAARNITEEGLKELRHIVDLQEFYTQRGEAERIKEMDDQFHIAVCRHSGRRVLSDTLIPLHMRIQKYRRASIERLTHSADIAAEHRNMLNAIEARDGDLAERLAEEHLRHAAQRILQETPV